MDRTYIFFSRIIPRKLRKKAIDVLAFINLFKSPESVLGFMVISTILTSFLIAFSLGTYLKYPFQYFFFPALLILTVVVCIYFVLLKEKRVRLIEESLPDALQLMSSNLRSGMTPDKALLLSARPEFGPLKEEIDIVGKKVALGKNIGSSLSEMADRVKSKRLVRAVELINSSLNSGGSLSVLLEATANELREQYLIDMKIKASVTMYVIFIFSAVALISPILFALSSFLVEVFTAIFSNIDLTSTVGISLPISISQINITPEFLKLFIISFVIVNCLMTSMLLGLIDKGNRKEGLKYFLPMALAAIAIYLITGYLVKSTLGTLFNF